MEREILVGVVSWSGRMDGLNSSLELELVTRTFTSFLELELITRTKKGKTFYSPWQKSTVEKRSRVLLQGTAVTYAILRIWL